MNRCCCVNLLVVVVVVLERSPLPPPLPPVNSVTLDVCIMGDGSTSIESLPKAASTTPRSQCHPLWRLGRCCIGSCCKQRRRRCSRSATILCGHADADRCCCCWQSVGFCGQSTKTATRVKLDLDRRFNGRLALLLRHWRRRRRSGRHHRWRLDEAVAGQQQLHFGATVEWVVKATISPLVSSIFRAAWAVLGWRHRRFSIAFLWPLQLRCLPISGGTWRWGRRRRGSAAAGVPLSLC